MGKGMLEKIIRISKFALKRKDAKDKEDVRTPPIYPPRHSEHVSLCNTRFLKDIGTKQSENKKDRNVPIIYFITPTYPRSEQIAELTRLAQTLLHIQNLHWVIAEDSPYCSEMVHSLLQRVDSIPYTHLSSPMPDIYKGLAMKDRPRGVSSRRAGLQWVLSHHQHILNQTTSQDNTRPSEGNVQKNQNPRHPSVIYFGDDDNT